MTQNKYVIKHKETGSYFWTNGRGYNDWRKEKEHASKFGLIDAENMARDIGTVYVDIELFESK